MLAVGASAAGAAARVTLVTSSFCCWTICAHAKIRLRAVRTEGRGVSDRADDKVGIRVLGIDCDLGCADNERLAGDSDSAPAERTDLKLLDEPAEDGVLDIFLEVDDFFLLFGNVGITPVATLYLTIVFIFASCSNSSCNLVDLVVSLWWADPPLLSERPWRPEPPLTDTTGQAGPPL